MKTISALALPITLLIGLYLLVSGDLFSPNAWLVVQLLALGLLPWARLSFQPRQFNIHAEPKESLLISSGPYKYIRHPMYIAVLAVLWVGILNHYSLLNLGLGIVVSFVVGARIMVEEQLLTKSIPGYAEYARQTKLIIPYVL